MATNDVSGAFSYTGDGSADDEPITVVHLRYDEHGGPFWNDEGCLGDDWDVWESMGLSRETYDACSGWTGDSDEKARLLRRLRVELPESVEVEKPYL